MKRNCNLSCCYIPLVFVIVSSFMFSGHAFSQDSTLLKRATWKTTLTFKDNRVVQTYLYDLTDTSLLIVVKPVRFRQSVPNADPTSVPYQQVDMMIVKRKGAAGKGVLIGTFSGATLGAIIGAITYKSCDGCILEFGRGFDIAIGAFLGTLSGGLTGLIIGALSKRKFIIGGDKEKFDKMKLSVLDRAYGNSRQ